MTNRIRGWIYLALGFALASWMASFGDYAYALTRLPK
jgi:hypothetical protein